MAKRKNADQGLSCYICSSTKRVEKHHYDCQEGKLSPETVPLCKRCHRTYHDLGVEWFDDEYLDKAIEIENRRRQIVYDNLKEPARPLVLLTREDIQRSDYFKKTHGIKTEPAKKRERLFSPVGKGIEPIMGWDWYHEHLKDPPPPCEMVVSYDGKELAAATGNEKRGTIKELMRVVEAGA